MTAVLVSSGIFTTREQGETREEHIKRHDEAIKQAARMKALKI